MTQAEVDAGGPISTIVTADSAESAPATDSLDVPVTLGPAIDVAASTTTASVGAGGQVVDYTFTVTNAGNQTLTGVSVSDADCDPATLVYAGGDANADAKLQLDETWTYTCERTVTQTEVDAGGPISTIVTADSAESAPATDSLDVPGDPGPRRSTWRPPRPRPRWARVARSWTTPSP